LIYHEGTRKIYEGRNVRWFEKITVSCVTHVDRIAEYTDLCEVWPNLSCHKIIPNLIERALCLRKSSWNVLQFENAVYLLHFFLSA